jgi:gluconate 5-dehydrogenase
MRGEGVDQAGHEKPECKNVHVHVRDLFDLSGKVAVITGGGTGIGRQMADALAEMGANIVLCARDGARCEEAAAEIAEAGVRALGFSCDVRSEDAVAELVKCTLDEFGRIDIVVNNAGTVWVAWPEETSLEGWRKVLDVNLTGVFLVSRAAGQIMIRQRAGRIINIASVAGLKGAPPEILNAIAYQASKGGVISFTRDLACKWGRHGINVNAIAPGWFPTEMTETLLAAHAQTLTEHVPLRRFGGENDLKGAVVYLASEASAYVTGQTLVVDGGESAW